MTFSYMFHSVFLLPTAFPPTGPLPPPKQSPLLHVTCSVTLSRPLPVELLLQPSVCDAVRIITSTVGASGGFSVGSSPRNCRSHPAGEVVFKCLPVQRVPKPDRCHVSSCSPPSCEPKRQNQSKQAGSWEIGRRMFLPFTLGF